VSRIQQTAAPTETRTGAKKQNRNGWGEKDAAGKRLYLGRADTNERYRKASNAVKSASRKFQNEHCEINTEMTHDRRDLAASTVYRGAAPKKKAVPGIIGEDGVIMKTTH
jgi:hypothetical protein